MTTRIEPIGECAEILPGYSIKSGIVDEPYGTHQVILGKHLTEGQPYRYADEHRLRITPSRGAGNYLVRRGDVLFVSRGVRNHAVLIESTPEPTLAPSTFYILRPKTWVEPGYLAWCLNQASVQAAISQARTGAGTPIVQRREFGEILMPVPPQDQQRRIACLSELMTSERQLRMRLLDETERYHRLLGQQVLESLGDMLQQRSGI